MSKTQNPSQQDYERIAKKRLATKAKPLGKEPSPPPLVKPLKRGK
jgi:hypothetical protein